MIAPRFRVAGFRFEVWVSMGVCKKRHHHRLLCASSRPWNTKGVDSSSYATTESRMFG